MRKKSSLFYKPKNQAPQKPKRKWVVLPYIWRAVKYTCMSIGAMILISLIVGFFLTASLLKGSDIEASLPKEMILFYRLDGQIPEGPPLSGLDALGAHKLSLSEIILSLEEAATDPRVKALIFSARNSELALSQIEELREAVKEFRERSGKPAYIYSTSYTEAGQGLALYSLASAFDEIWMSPMGGVSVSGMQIEQPYLRGLLDRLGIEPLFLQREEYKGVFENFMNERMSEPSRESYQALIKSFVKEFLKDVISDRSRLAEEQELSSLINKGYFLDDQALKIGLIDKVEYGDVLLEQLREELGGDAELKTPDLIRVGHYYSYLQSDDPAKDDIALIYIQGPIMILSDGQEGNTLVGETSQSADKIASLITQAADDPEVKVIVLRVDSPGGSPSASEVIRRAVLRAQAKEKAVIVSMGSMAASGGYWVSAPADYIFASPTTITGSIGVAGGKVNMREFWNHLDVNWDKVSIGKNAGLYSMNSGFTESERDIMEASMDNIYDMFLGIVAEGREMEKEEVRNVAKGRVWSGAQAIDAGLVDELGGLNDALDYAANIAGYKSRKDMNIIMLPEPKSPFEEIIEIFQKTASLPAFMQQQSAMWNVMLGEEQRKKIMQDAAVLQNGSQGGVYVYEPLDTLR